MEQHALRVIVKLGQCLDCLGRSNDQLEGPHDSAGWKYVGEQVERAVVAAGEAKAAFYDLMDAIGRAVTLLTIQR